MLSILHLANTINRWVFFLCYTIPPSLIPLSSSHDRLPLLARFSFRPSKLPSQTSLIASIGSMASSTTSSRVWILIFVIFMMLLVMLSEARSFKQKRIDSHLLLEDLGYDKVKLHYFQRKSTLDSGTARVSPGGPNADHHSNPPGRY